MTDAEERVILAAIAMRSAHEGCVTDPPCGQCTKCDFDAAVDAYLALIRRNPGGPAGAVGMIQEGAE